MKKSIPTELLDLFEDVMDRCMPWDPFEAPDGSDAYYFFRVSEGVGILKCSLRDALGNEEDFEWELNLKTR